MILPDVRGLHLFFEELAMRYAERGIDALAIDYWAGPPRATTAARLRACTSAGGPLGEPRG